MYKAYKFRLYPNIEQQELLEKHFGSCRFVYNKVLSHFKDAYAASKEPWNRNRAIKMITELKKSDEYVWLNEVNSQSLQQSVMDLDSAFRRFFSHNSGFPKYKSKRSSRASFRIPQHIEVLTDEELVRFPKFKEGIKVQIHRPIAGDIKFATISRTPARKYYISLVCSIEPLGESTTKPTENNAVGIDLGIKDFAVLSDGRKYNLPNTDAIDKRIKRLCRRLSRKKIGSKNRDKARVALSKKYEKLVNIRHDFLHKLSRSLVDENQIDFYFMEDLNIKGMLKNRKLARSIQNSCWATFATFLTYKAAWVGKEVRKIDRWYPSSKICSGCGFKKEDLSISDREWTCPSCGSTHDRDINAAINIRNIGITTAGTAESNACGEDVRPATTGAIFYETGSSALQC